jgi:hypothetical protein
VIDLPLNLYLKYQMAAYQENLATGEEVSIAVRAWDPDLAEVTQDFVLFDVGSERPAMVWMKYDDEGHLTGLEYSDYPGDLALAIRHRAVALAHAVPLSEFTTLADTG